MVSKTIDVGSIPTAPVIEMIKIPVIHSITGIFVIIFPRGNNCGILKGRKNVLAERQVNQMFLLL